jgi:pimeloyl-ACP methyl ester carboxylesterase
VAEDLTVVQWDQRGSGRTLGRNGKDSAAALTIDRLVQDGVELADALRTSLRKDKIIIVGHSFGSVLGVLMAKTKPELFSAFVGTGQVGDPSRGYTVAFEALIAHARVVGDARAVRELEEIGPPPTRWPGLRRPEAVVAESLRRCGRLHRKHAGVRARRSGIHHPDVNDWLDDQIVSGDRLVPESSAMTRGCAHGAGSSCPSSSFKAPTTSPTPTSLPRTFVDGVDAPRKACHDQGRHFAVFMNAPEFLQELRALLATSAGPRR